MSSCCWVAPMRPLCPALHRGERVARRGSPVWPKQASLEPAGIAPCFRCKLTRSQSLVQDQRQGSGHPLGELRPTRDHPASKTCTSDAVWGS